MVVRKEGHVHIAGADVLTEQRSVDVLHDIVMGQHNRFGHGGGAGGEEDDGRGFGVNGKILIFLKIRTPGIFSFFSQLRDAQVSLRLIHADILADLGGAGCFQGFHLLFMGRIENQHVRIASCQRGLQLLIRQPLVQRNADAQTAQNGEIAFHPFLPVLSDDGNAFSLHAAEQQGSAQLVHSFIKCSEGNVFV